MYINTVNSLIRVKKHFQLKNVVLFLRTFLTQMRRSEFSMCMSVYSINIIFNFILILAIFFNDLIFFLMLFPIATNYKTLQT